MSAAGRSVKMPKKPTNNVLTTEASFKLADLYFKQVNIMYSHLYNSYDKFIDDDIITLLSSPTNSIFYEMTTATKLYRHKFIFTDIAIKPAMIEGEDEFMYPAFARTMGTTYAAKLVATITQVQEITDIATGTVETVQVGSPEYEYPVTMLPIMVRSKYCSINLNKGVDNTECKYDPGGYFIIKGQEKAVLSLERMIDNKPLVTVKKESGVEIYAVQVVSRIYTDNEVMQGVSIKIKPDRTMSLKVHLFDEIPVFILFRALGIESDRDIINITTYDENDTEMINLVRTSLESVMDSTGTKITTQDQAIDYLITKMRVVRKYSETDKDIRQKEKKIHLDFLLTNTLLPHTAADKIKKAMYLGYMINRLLGCYLGRYEIDDRDSYINKRVELPGMLMYELFKQYFKKMLNDCNKHFKKRHTHVDNPPNIINQIKPNIIESGLNAALMTGKWGKRNGVAQMLQRMSFIQMQQQLRRVNAPTIDSATNKLTGPRNLHSSSVPGICPVQTPEGHNVGLSKQPSIITNITIMQKTQLKIIKSFLQPRMVSLRDVPYAKLREYTKIFLNGDWIGLTLEPRKLYEQLRQKKLTGAFDVTTSITHSLRSEVETRELYIYCDSGRLYHPALAVKDNQLVITQEQIDQIQIDEPASANEISSWYEFMIKHPGVIEYIDIDETANAMLAFHVKEVIAEREKQLYAQANIDKMQIDGNYTMINRYDDYTYKMYNYCEIHPSLILGEVASNIPFCNNNQGPRNMYSYSQAKHGMGIYASNYRSRLDLSYILYNPQRPLISTRASKYVNTYYLPAGENAIVAIGCMTGFNQEDSLIFNKSAIERGLFRSTSFKKYEVTVQKNQSTSQDDIFMKPDATKVIGALIGSYDKLNDHGYAPEETHIEMGDFVLGMVAPIQAQPGSVKTFKDKSEMYKSHTPGVVDRVWTDIVNSEGYDMRTMRIRSERIPHIGDKFCSRHGQKGTVGLCLRASDMPFTEHGIQPDLIVNPHAIPSRMTIGHLIECLAGKLAALDGCETDGTPFEDIDQTKLEDALEKHGYNRYGNEFMYNGLTGKKQPFATFIGPTYYLRLKHMVSDKIHARAIGPKTLLTRQAPEGRSKEGGLRFGEMERDAMIAHGLATFLYERLVTVADEYATFICGKCGLFAQRLQRKDNQKFASNDDIYWCPACKNDTDISKIRIPYAAKLLFQEMMSLNIAPRIRVKKNVFC